MAADNTQVVEVFFEVAESLCLYVKRAYNEMDEDIVNYTLEAIEEVLRLGIMIADEQQEEFGQVIVILNELALLISSNNPSVTVIGRPIAKEQLVYLTEQGFRTEDIANIFGCSRRTIERRREEYGITLMNSVSVTDADLDTYVQEIATLFPRCGEKTVSGRLRSYGIRVPRHRIRECLRRIDPSGVVHRCRGVLHSKFVHPMRYGM